MLVQEMTDASLKVFFDSTQLPIGDDISKMTHRGDLMARALLFCIGPDVTKLPPWQQSDLDALLVKQSSERTVIAVLLPGTNPD
jgi:hypothetical protein